MQKIKNLFKLILAQIYFPFLTPSALKKIKERNITSHPHSAYDWTQNFKVGPNIRGLNINFQSSQIKSEILGLLDELSARPPKVILEIGTATGGTLFMFTQIAQDDATIISIDLPFGLYGAGYFPYKIPLIQAFTRKDQQIHLLRLDSHKKETLEQLQSILNGKKIDFLFIDGDHTYEGVKADFESYHPLVAEGGSIAFHDIVDNDFDTSFGTQKFWKEIKGTYEHKEFIEENRGKTGCGIGLIKLP